MKPTPLSLLLFFCGITFSIYAQNSFYPTHDAYVRGGSNAGSLYGLETQLSLKNSSNNDYDRVIYMEFDLRGFADLLENATLSMTTKSYGTAWFGSAAKIYLMKSAVWDESTINWTNAPSLSGNSKSILCSNGSNHWDITSFIEEALLGDSTFTLGIEVPTNGSEDIWAHFHSKEAAAQENRPVIVLNNLSSAPLIPAINSVDWSVAGVEGGIPNYTNVVDVSSIGLVADGATDNSISLQNAINSTSTPTVFLFSEGTYFFESSIQMKNNIIIRGECVDKTVLNFDLSGDALPSFWFKSDEVGSEVVLNSGFVKGSTSITVANASSFKVGDYIEIIQDNDSALMYTNPTWDASWAANSVGQMVPITAINGNTLTLKYALMHTFSSALNVRGRSVEMIVGSGIENLKIHRIDNGNDYNLRFDYAANCWIRNIEGSYADRGHVAINSSSFIEVRESYFHHAHDYGGGGHGYGINLQDHATSCLFENNIFYYLRHTFLAKEGAIGNVFSYNYSHTPNGSVNDIALHGHYGLMNLMEGNVVQKIIAGDYWGPSGPGNTYFRNRVETADIVMQDATHFQNIVANEILNGTVSITASNNTWQLSNKNLSGFVDVEHSGSIRSSLYLDEKPLFFSGYTWPGIGPEFTLNQHTIPAKERWDNGAIDLVPCLDNGLITNTNEITSELKVYPNPAQNLVTVSGLERKNNLLLFDVHGKLIGSYQVSESTYALSINSLSNGIYWLKVQNAQSSPVFKIVKK